jgi:hypothetical protein
MCRPWLDRPQAQDSMLAVHHRTPTPCVDAAGRARNASPASRPKRPRSSHVDVAEVPRRSSGLWCPGLVSNVCSSRLMVWSSPIDRRPLALPARDHRTPRQQRRHHRPRPNRAPRHHTPTPSTPRDVRHLRHPRLRRLNTTLPTTPHPLVATTPRRHRSRQPHKLLVRPLPHIVPEDNQAKRRLIREGRLWHQLGPRRNICPS